MIASPSIRRAPETRSISGSPSRQIKRPAVVPSTASVRKEESQRLPRGDTSPAISTITSPAVRAMIGESPP